MVEKLGVSQTYKVHVPQKCKSTPSAARFAKHLLGERPSVRYIEGWILLHKPEHFEKLTQFLNVFFAAFRSGPVPEYLVSYRMAKDHVTFHSTMCPRKWNSCSYLVQFCAHVRKCYGRVVCYILFQNVACALITEYGLNGLNVFQDLPPPQDVVLKEIVHRNLIGQHFLQVQVTWVTCQKISNFFDGCWHPLLNVSRDNKGHFFLLTISSVIFSEKISHKVETLAYM